MPCSPPALWACGAASLVHLHEFGAESVAIFGEFGDHAGMFDAVEVLAAYRVIVSGPADIEALLGEHETLLVDDLPAGPAAGVGGAHARHRGLVSP